MIDINVSKEVLVIGSGSTGLLETSLSHPLVYNPNNIKTNNFKK